MVKCIVLRLGFYSLFYVIYFLLYWPHSHIHKFSYNVSWTYILMLVTNCFWMPDLWGWTPTSLKLLELIIPEQLWVPSYSDPVHFVCQSKRWVEGKTSLLYLFYTYQNTAEMFSNFSIVINSTCKDLLAGKMTMMVDPCVLDYGLPNWQTKGCVPGILCIVLF